MWGEEGEVGVVDVFHVWGGEKPVDLGGEVDDVALMVDYAPYYAIGNFCIAGTRPFPQPI